jgi:hypothetical protein
LPGLFGTVAEPRQAERALYAWAKLAFDPEAVEKLKIPFLFFIRFQTEFKLQKFVSKYLELQKLLNQFHWIHNFLIYPIKLFRKTETFSLRQFLLKLK